jgi:hypothetical protein
MAFVSLWGVGYNPVSFIYVMYVVKELPLFGLLGGILLASSYILRLGR